MRRFGAFLMVTGFTMTISGAAASARPNFPDQIPATPAGCGTCHLDSRGGGPRNPFGSDAGVFRNDGIIDWAGLSGLDSDGDGRTNGEELGDPDGAWVSGDPAPAGPYTLPGVVDERPEPEPQPDGEPEPLREVSSDGEGGCTHTSPTSQPGWLFIVVLVLCCGRTFLRRGPDG